MQECDCFDICCVNCQYHLCDVCGDRYGSHYTSNDGTWYGCADCNDCEGFIRDGEY
jgi:ssDNA-binding Zn-finger/Zn-ribbon topoisomerase 1